MEARACDLDTESLLQIRVEVNDEIYKRIMDLEKSITEKDRKINQLTESLALRSNFGLLPDEKANEIISEMQSNFQREPDITIYDHGMAVANEFIKLFDWFVGLDEEYEKWKHLPSWANDEYRYRIGLKLKGYHADHLYQYCLFHDMGKHLCATKDDEGKVHFPDHANVSANYWKQCGGGELIERFIRDDMQVHTIKGNYVPTWYEMNGDRCFVQLVVGLAEIFANATMFGGFDSDSYKMKFKQIKTRGNQLIRHVWS